MQKSVDYTKSNRYHINKMYFESPLRVGNFLLLQIGRLFCLENTVIPRHVQGNLFELTLVKGGRGTILTNDVPVSVETGDIHLSFPGDFHEIRTGDADPLQYDFMAFRTDDPVLAEELEQVVASAMPASCRVIRNERIGALVGDALAELNQRETYSVVLLRAILEQITVYLIREFRFANTSSGEERVADAKMLCCQIMNYIDTHIYSMACLTDLTKRFCYNYTYLSSLFRRTTSETLAGYYRNRRLETARLLLLEGKLKSTQIAESLHYSSVHTFSRAFREKYGESPKVYQTEWRSGENGALRSR